MQDHTEKVIKRLYLSGIATPIMPNPMVLLGD